VEFNPAAEVLFGYDRQRAIGANLGELIVPPAQRAKHAQGLARYIATEKAVMLGKRLEMGAMRADGRELTVELSITRIPHDGPPLFTGFIRDITERKHAEAEVRQLNQDLERRVGERTAELETSNKELEAFSYSVSHDLRSPLRAIDGFSKSVVEECGDALSERGRRDLDRVRAAARQMGMLIDDLLDLARLSRAEMHRQRVDLTAIGEGVAAALRQAEPERAATIVIAEGLVTEGDSQLLRVVLDNLLRNAWKFTARHPTARIEVGCTGDNGTRQYFVRDDGAGFDMAHADLLFQPFKRLHRQTDFEGTGIGLATVQRIIQRHGGRIWAESAVEHGATFYFTLGERPRR
jgi:PAS domain S-box-containing protein